MLIPVNVHYINQVYLLTKERKPLAMFLVSWFYAFQNVTCIVLAFTIAQVKIIIVDSVTFHFRQDFDDMALRTRLLSGMALKFMNLAKNYNLAVSNDFLCILSG